MSFRVCRLIEEFIQGPNAYELLKTVYTASNYDFWRVYCGLCVMHVRKRGAPPTFQLQVQAIVTMVPSVSRFFDPLTYETGSKPFSETGKMQHEEEEEGCGKCSVSTVSFSD